MSTGRPAPSQDLEVIVISMDGPYRTPGLRRRVTRLAGGTGTTSVTERPTVSGAGLSAISSEPTPMGTVITTGGGTGLSTSSILIRATATSGRALRGVSNGAGGTGGPPIVNPRVTCTYNSGTSICYTKVSPRVARTGASTGGDPPRTRTGPVISGTPCRTTRTASKVTNFAPFLL